MFRFLTIALLAGTAIPATAIAQEVDGSPGDHGRFRVERAISGSEPRPERAQRPERPAFAQGQRPERAPRFDRPERSVTPAAPSALPVAVQQDRGGWRGNRGGDGQRGGWSGNRGGDGQRGGWSGNRGGDGQRGWRGNAPATPPAAVAQPQPVPQARDRGQDRDWNRATDGRRDWDRNGQRDGGQRNWSQSDNRRNWNRDNGRRDWNRNNDRRDWNRNDGRRDWNDRRWNNNDRRWDGNDRRWDGNRGSRNWDRGWRSDRRYNWQGYRASNRYAFRWPQYYAPRGWDYGYRRFGIGATLFSGLFAQDYWISDPFNYRLPPVDWPFRWVRYYDDALLVDTTTGQVVDVIPGIFW